MDACLPDITVATYVQHPLHASERIWGETNCYLDLWIELLHALKLEPRAAMGFAARQNFEGDQFTFTKFDLRDLETIFGLTVQELAIFDPVEVHVSRQMSRGRMCLVEVDPYYLPDTGVAAYRRRHGKTTIAINRIDVASRRLEYFHNAGYFAVEGDDFAGLFEPPSRNAALRPYVEFVRLSPERVEDRVLRTKALEAFEYHWSKRPRTNPIRTFQTVLRRQAALASRSEQGFHDFAFHSLRLLGANFELLGSAIEWLYGAGDPRIAPCLRVAETVKAAQFSAARAIAKQRFDDLPLVLTRASEAWDDLFSRPPARAA
jgi:hypothetical protein